MNAAGSSPAFTCPHDSGKAIPAPGRARGDQGATAVAIRPLRGNGLVVCEPSLVFGIIDTLYGGVGKFQTRIEGRDFSPTEQRVINRLVDVIATEYKKAWQGIYPLELAYQRSEMQPQFANIATPSEIVVSTAFQLEIGDLAGAIHVCMPYATLEPIRDVLYSSVQGDAIEVDRRWVTIAALKALADDGAIERSVVAEAITKYGIDINKPNPMAV